MDSTGFIHVYTGNGKGKTTSAIGLAVRALGAGFKVLFIQFVKGQSYSEHKILAQFENLTLKQFGREGFIHSKPSDEDIRVAREGYEYARKELKSGRWDLVVLDEANIAVFFNLFSEDELLELMRTKAHNTELVITGRYATQRIKNAADLVTEMRELKHYFRKGVTARTGIEK